MHIIIFYQISQFIINDLSMHIIIFIELCSDYYKWFICVYNFFVKYCSVYFKYLILHPSFLLSTAVFIINDLSACIIFYGMLQCSL